MALDFVPRGDLVSPKPKVSTWPFSNKKVPSDNNGALPVLSKGKKSEGELKPILK